MPIHEIFACGSDFTRQKARRAVRGTRAASALDFLHDEGFDDVAFLDVLELLEGDAAPPHGMFHPAGVPRDLKCSGEMNSPSAKVLLRKTLVWRKSVVFCFAIPNRYGTSELGVLFFIRTFPVND